MKLENSSGLKFSLQACLSGQHTEILDQIDQKAFEERRREFEIAYAKFAEALKLVGLAIEMQNTIARDQHLSNAVQIMCESLAIYNDPRLMPEMNAAGKLRRLECAWTIGSAIAYVISLQNELGATYTSLATLQDKIQRDLLEIASACDSQTELDFIFPELIRIQRQDLAALKLWRTQIEIVQSLPPSELENLPDLELVKAPELETIEIPEEARYIELQSKSNFYALRDQLRFMIKPELRTEYETAIEHRSIEVGYPAIARTNWQEVSDLTVANLFWHLKR